MNHYTLYKKFYMEEIETEENKMFKKDSPHIKSEWLIIDTELINKVRNWYKHALHPRDKISIDYWMNKDIQKYPAIIVHVYRNEKHIIDGWHRLYSAIQKGYNKTLVYVKE